MARYPADRTTATPDHVEGPIAQVRRRAPWSMRGRSDPAANSQGPGGIALQRKGPLRPSPGGPGALHVAERLQVQLARGIPE